MRPSVIDRRLDPLFVGLRKRGRTRVIGRVEGERTHKITPAHPRSVAQRVSLGENLCEVGTDAAI